MYDELNNKQRFNIQSSEIGFFLERADLNKDGDLSLTEFKKLMIQQMDPSFNEKFKRTRQFSAHGHAKLSPYLGGKAYDLKLDTKKWTPKAFLGREFFQEKDGVLHAEFDPVFVSWTAVKNWRPAADVENPEEKSTLYDALYFSPEALGMVDDHGKSYELTPCSLPTVGADRGAWRAVVPIEQLCWVLSPKTLFVRVMLPQAYEKIQKKADDEDRDHHDFHMNPSGAFGGLAGNLAGGLTSGLGHVKGFAQTGLQSAGDIASTGRNLAGGIASKTGSLVANSAGNLAGMIPGRDSQVGPEGSDRQGTALLDVAGQAGRSAASAVGTISSAMTSVTGQVASKSTQLLNSLSRDTGSKNGDETSWRCGIIRKTYDDKLEAKDLWWYKMAREKSPMFSREESVEFQERNFINWRLLASYYLEQLLLFTEMCLERSYNSIYWMQDRFTYTMLTSMMSNELLPDEIRSAFTLLMLRVYVDRYPHTPLGLPDPIQCYETDKAHIKLGDWQHGTTRTVEEMLKLDGEKVDRNLLPQFRIQSTGPLSNGRIGPNCPFHILKFLLFGVRGGSETVGSNPDELASNKFFLLRHFIQSYFGEMNGRQVVANVEQNKLILELLDVVAKLMTFGFYSTLDKIREICRPMFELLDSITPGREDRYLPHKELTLEGKQLLGEGQVWSRYDAQNEANIVVMDSKRAIIDALLHVVRVKHDYQLRCITALFYDSLQKNRKELIKKTECEENQDMYILTDEFRSKFHEIFEPTPSSGDMMALDALRAGLELSVDPKALALASGSMVEASRRTVTGSGRPTKTAGAFDKLSLKAIASEVAITGRPDVKLTEVCMDLMKYGMHSPMPGIQSSHYSLILMRLLSDLCRTTRIIRGCVLTPGHSIHYAPTSHRSAPGSDPP